MTTAPPCLPSPISTTGSLLSAPTSPCPTQAPPVYTYPHPRAVPPCSCHLHPFPHLVHRSPAALLSPAFLSPLVTTMMIISHLSVTEDAHHSWAQVLATHVFEARGKISNNNTGAVFTSRRTFLLIRGMMACQAPSPCSEAGILCKVPHTQKHLHS